MLKIILAVWAVVVCINIGFEALEDRKLWPLYGASDWIFTGAIILSGPLPWVIAGYYVVKGFIKGYLQWYRNRKG